MTERYPDVSANCTDVKFPDSRGRRGQRNTKVTDVAQILGFVKLGSTSFGRAPRFSLFEIAVFNVLARHLTWAQLDSMPRSRLRSARLRLM